MGDYLGILTFDTIMRKRLYGYLALVAFLVVATVGVNFYDNFQETQAVSQEQRKVGDLKRVRQIATRYKDSILQLYNDSGRFRGTAWFVGEDLLVTNQHVIDGVEDPKVKLTTGEKINVFVLIADKENDLALLDPDLPDDYSTQPLPLAKQPLEKYQEIVQFGYPYKLNYYDYGATLKRGRWRGHPVWKAKLRVGPGNSGSPVFNKDGKVVAVVEGMRRGIDVSILLPIRLVRQLKKELSKDKLIERFKKLKKELRDARQSEKTM